MRQKGLIGSLIITLMLGIFTMNARADWAGNESERISMRTLKGKAFLTEPIVGATVQVCNRWGQRIYSFDSATGEDGRFSITCPLPESFKVVISGGNMAGVPFSEELSSPIRWFDATQTYKINAITTLVDEYMKGHPFTFYAEAKRSVAKFLSIPRSVDLDEVIYSSEWYCYYFSHYLFMKDANANLGLSAFVGTLMDQLNSGKTCSYYDSNSIGSSMFQNALTALLQGALSKIGGEGTGWILGLLDNGGSDVDSRLTTMENDLKEILNDLVSIEDELNGLTKLLNLDVTDIETYIQGLSVGSAISPIKAHYGPAEQNDPGDSTTLKYYSSMRSSDVNPTLKQDMSTFATGVTVYWDIETQVQTIHDAIFPDVGGTDGLLDLWTTNFLLTGMVRENLMGYYQTLEQYFSILLLYQFKGANMIVEAKNFLGTGDAYDYMLTFNSLIQDETERFMQCIVTLIAHGCDLTSNSSFLPPSAQDVLARANFFVIQTLSEDHYGLRLGAFGTKNCIHSLTVLGADTYDNDTQGIIWVPGELGNPMDLEMTDIPYDDWGDGVWPLSDLSNLKMGNTYSLLQADPNESQYGLFGPGNHTVGYVATNGSNYQNGVGTVQTYNAQYFPDSSGAISYGYSLQGFRAGGADAMMANGSFVREHYNVTKTGDVDSSWSDALGDNSNLVMVLSADSPYDSESSTISQDLQWGHTFTFNGNSAQTAYLTATGTAVGNVYFENQNEWDNTCTISVSIGLYDQTDRKTANSIKYSKTPSEQNDTQDLGVFLEEEQISVTLEPGHTYNAYANITGYGTNNSGRYSYVVEFAPLQELYMSFIQQ